MNSIGVFDSVHTFETSCPHANLKTLFECLWLLVCSRVKSGAGKLVISARKVREIEDPIVQLFNTLHKIIYITQVRLYSICKLSVLKPMPSNRR